MKFKLILTSVFSLLVIFSSLAQLVAPDHEKSKAGEITIQPIKHATLVLGYNKKIVYIDPTGGAEAFKGLEEPDLILVTDIHGDHYDPKTLESLNLSKAVLIVPQAVADKLPGSIAGKSLVIMKNGDHIQKAGIDVEALPMYNLPESSDSRHTKGRGNGYMLTMGGKNIYISGDTEAIPEMRALKNIDIAFVCMNLPYTMDVNQAAAGILDFKPAIVYPYHYRGQDIHIFKDLVNKGNPNIDVRLRDWYGDAK